MLCAPDLKFCGADEMRIEALKNNPQLAKAVIAREAQLNAFTKEFEKNNVKRIGSTLFIKVMF